MPLKDLGKPTATFEMASEPLCTYLGDGRGLGLVLLWPSQHCSLGQGQDTIDPREGIWFA